MLNYATRIEYFVMPVGIEYGPAQMINAFDTVA